jgi:hypothetical protein
MTIVIRRILMTIGICLSMGMALVCTSAALAADAPTAFTSSAPTTGMPTSLTPAAPTEGGNSNFVSYGAPKLAQQANISLPTAERDIEVQQAAGNIVPKLEHKLGAGYAGLWFDPQTSEFHVGVVSSADQTAAEETMDSARVLPNTVFDKVQNNWLTVEELAKKWDEKLKSIEDSQQAMVIADPTINGVTVELASNLSSETITQTEVAAASASSGPVRVVPISPETLDAKPMSCSFPYCTRPLRGGIGLISSPEKGWYTFCTAGFFVRDHNNYPYLLTAGHCVYPENSAYWREAWGTAYPGGETGCGLGHMVAQVLNHTGDAAVIATEGCEPPAPEPEIVVWGMTEYYPIEKVPLTAYKGMYECHIGQTSRTQCGDVEATNTTVYFEYKEEGKGIIGVEHEDWLCAISEAGDSGGPWVHEYQGTAIETGGGENDCASYGYELSYALSALGVHLPAE